MAMTGFAKIWAVLAVALLAACSGKAPEQGGVPALTQEIMRLSPDIDPAEARRAAEVAYGHSQRLKREWNVVDPPLTHNNKVHSGEREKGLCNDWAQAMTRRNGSAVLSSRPAACFL